MSNNFQLILKSSNYEVHALTERPGAARPLRPRPDASDEEIRPLVNSLRFGPGSRGAPRSIMVASVEAAGHSASVCLRVARALASSDTETVCLVDANLSDPSMHRAFGVSRDPGVAEVLQDARSSHIVPSEVEPGLWLLPAGSGSLGPAGLSLDRVTAMTDELTSSFDWVLADIGPIEPAGRTAAMAGCADGVVLVVAANATRRAVALKVKEDIVAAGGRVLGAVLAERTFPIPEVIYRRL